MRDRGFHTKGTGTLSLPFGPYSPVLSPALCGTPKLAKEIEAHQRRMDELRENYTFHEISLIDELDSNGAVNRASCEEKRYSTGSPNHVE
jgi:hypothetical protein